MMMVLWPESAKQVLRFLLERSRGSAADWQDVYCADPDNSKVGEGLTWLEDHGYVRVVDLAYAPTALAKEAEKAGLLK